MCRPPDEDERAAAHARLFCPTLVRAVLRWLGRLGVPLCHRSDVAGQVWLNAWESWPRFDPKRGRPERWLNAITVHVASHYHERAQHRREELVELIEVLDPAPDAAAVMECDNIRTSTIDAVNELEPELRFVLVAHDLNGVSMAKIAEDAGLPLSTLYKRRTKAIDALRGAIRLRESRGISTCGVTSQ
ncbi:sigma-70 family RNA polymerase sigma factor [Sorangium sp. So ce341]|uniref:sigma-70 family RNA polymerase sigma factor n=1 Tax=Sorangium sp. So ce341 TaxID=3133302 RepID=UPI003F625AA9